MKANVGSLFVTKRELKVLIEALDYALDCAESEADAMDCSRFLSKATRTQLREMNFANRQHERFAWIRAQLNKEPGK